MKKSIIFLISKLLITKIFRTYIFNIIHPPQNPPASNSRLTLIYWFHATNHRLRTRRVFRVKVNSSLLINYNSFSLINAPRTTHIVITMLQNKPPVPSAPSLVYITPNTTRISHILLPTHGTIDTEDFAHGRYDSNPVTSNSEWIREVHNLCGYSNATA